MPFESCNCKRFGKILTINPFSYFIAVFRRAFWESLFRIEAFSIFSKPRCRDRISQKRFPDNYGLDHNYLVFPNNIS